MTVIRLDTAVRAKRNVSPLAGNKPNTSKGGVGRQRQHSICLSFRYLFAAALATYWLSLYPLNRIIWVSMQKYSGVADIECSVTPAPGAAAASVNGDSENGNRNADGPARQKQDQTEDDVDADSIGNDKLTFVEHGLSIAPGELPGYTGWARPERTLAGQFEISAVSSTQGVAGEEWFVDVTCEADECKRGGALFYLRAYGPAVITGTVDDEGNGSYRASFHPVDTGRYVVEVVLDFSRKPKYDIFPLGVNDTEIAYEGYLVPGFPMQVTVNEPKKKRRAGKSGGAVASEAAVTVAVQPTDPKKKWCTLDQLLETDSGSGLTRGRWKVVDNVRTRWHKQVTPDGDGVSLLGYQHGLNSLGVKLRYENKDCNLLSYSRVQRDTQGNHLVDKCFSDLGIANSPRPEEQIHVVFVGCSVMRLMRTSFQFLLKKSSMTNIRTTLIDARRGLFRTLPKVKRELNNITATFPHERRIIIFNTGLHDIDRLCSSRMEPARMNDQVVMGRNITGPCADTYRDQFRELVDFIDEYPAELKVFRSTTAGWLKYGNYGFNWPKEIVQPFVRSHHFVSYINDIAFDILKETGNEDMLIMDGFWTSLARPDHTEIGPNGAIGKHMVHPGVEVMDALARKFMMIIIRHMCSDTLDA